MNQLQTLHDLISSGKKIMPKEVARLGMQIAQSLGELHDRDVVLGDMQPTSVQLQRAANGLWQATTSEVANQVTSQVTSEEAGRSASPYMAPEVAEGQGATVRSDLFSLGCVLYHMCTGQPPFTGRLSADNSRDAADKSPAPIEVLNPSAPLALIGIIERLMSHDPQDRFASAGEVAERLGKVTKSKELAVLDDLSDGSGLLGDPQHEKSRQLLMGLVVLFFVLLIPLAWYNFLAPKKAKRRNPLDPPAVMPVAPVPADVPQQAAGH